LLFDAQPVPDAKALATDASSCIKMLAVGIQV
jgi:hypothetical protein